MGGRPCFACAPGHETLAAELAELVDGTWEITQGVADVMIMANGADRARSAPHPSLKRSVGLVAQVGDHDACSDTPILVTAPPVDEAPSDPYHKGERK